MRQLEWCYKNVVRSNCPNYEHSSCEQCVLHNLYMQGIIESIGESTWTIEKDPSNEANSYVIVCNTCKDRQTIKFNLTTGNIYEYLNTTYSFCRHCGSLMRVVDPNT